MYYSGGLRFEGCSVQKIWVGPFLCGACENFPAHSLQKCFDSNIFVRISILTGTGTSVPNYPD